MPEGNVPAPCEDGETIAACGERLATGVANRRIKAEEENARRKTSMVLEGQPNEATRSRTGRAIGKAEPVEPGEAPKDGD
jgi:hypothetical protein